MTDSLRIVIFGLSLSSWWGNGHATTFRALIRGLAERGHAITFVERDRPWYAVHRDLPAPPYCKLVLYRDLHDLHDLAGDVASADAVIVGSFVPDGVAVGDFVQRHARGVTAFYDIDTPVTLAKLSAGDAEYLARSLIPGFDLYFSFTSGPALAVLERVYGARRALPLYCSVDPDIYRPQRTEKTEKTEKTFALGYLGTYSADRQPALERLLIAPARHRPDLRFVVAGAQFPAHIAWPENVTRVDHVAPADHPAFYASLDFALNLTRADMVRAGHSPSVRLFEAAACGTPIISDPWPGLAQLFAPGRDILLASTTDDVLSALDRREEAHAIGAGARRRVLSAHTGAHRARELEEHLRTAIVARARRARHLLRTAAVLQK